MLTIESTDDEITQTVADWARWRDAGAHETIIMEIREIISAAELRGQRQAAKMIAKRLTEGIGQ